MLRELFDRVKRIFVATRRQQGFTLLELMIVIAIIGVLVAIAIPTFSGVLEKGREATDLANVRSAYAEVMIAAIQQDESSTLYETTTKQYKKTVKLTQKLKGWETEKEDLNIGGVAATDTAHWIGEPNKNGKCKVVYDSLEDELKLIWSGYTIEIEHQWIENKDGTLTLGGNLSQSWPASAVNESIEAEVGQKVVLKAITQEEFPNLYAHMNNGGYEIGVYMLDNNNNVLADTGGCTINGSGTQITLSPSKWKFPDKTGVKDGTEVKLSIQFFKMKDTARSGSIRMTEAEVEELETLFTIEEQK